MPSPPQQVRPDATIWFASFLASLRAELARHVHPRSVELLRDLAVTGDATDARAGEPGRAPQPLPSSGEEEQPGASVEEDQPRSPVTKLRVGAASSPGHHQLGARSYERTESMPGAPSHEAALGAWGSARGMDATIASSAVAERRVSTGYPVMIPPRSTARRGADAALSAQAPLARAPSGSVPCAQSAHSEWRPGAGGPAARPEPDLSPDGRPEPAEYRASTALPIAVSPRARRDSGASVYRDNRTKLPEIPVSSSRANHASGMEGTGISASRDAIMPGSERAPKGLAAPGVAPVPSSAATTPVEAVPLDGARRVRSLVRSQRSAEAALMPVGTIERITPAQMAESSRREASSDVSAASAASAGELGALVGAPRVVPPHRMAQRRTRVDAALASGPYAEPRDAHEAIEETRLDVLDSRPALPGPTRPSEAPATPSAARGDAAFSPSAHAARVPDPLPFRPQATVSAAEFTPEPTDAPASKLAHELARESSRRAEMQVSARPDDDEFADKVLRLLIAEARREGLEL
ncbi:hypothetical protein Hoch_1536 [Haliangium ochraceum DSM 14365]|uniref:Uncharacterized protein n=1 Tax=Haliangium ochraceum (strain DSM 14365 / JCM 11303 / SMP-2) TaxID=502025 RepID=D0LVV4_HALO1|nr:hypothetical protein Hoch_1536 [Haliangium ochraceum DSM 14365]